MWPGNHGDDSPPREQLKEFGALVSNGGKEDFRERGTVDGIEGDGIANVEFGPEAF